MQIKKWLATVLICIIIFAGLGFVKFTQIQAAIAFGESFPEPSETVTSIKPELIKWSPQYAVEGRVLAPQQVNLNAEVGGIIDQVNAQSGEQVKAGDTFLVINSAQEEAELRAIEAQIELAKLDVARAQELLKQNATGQQELDRALAQLKVSQAQADAITAVIAKKRVTFPFTGRLGLHSLDVGQFVEANTPLVDLSNTSQGVWVDFTVPQNKVEWLSRPIFVSNGNNSVKAELLTRANSIDPMTRKLPIRSKVNITEGLFPNQIVQVLLSSPQVLDVFSIPNTALRFDAIGSFVFVLTNDNEGNAFRAKRLDVDIVSQGQTQSLITASLDVSQEIANIGAFKLRDGILVNIAQPVRAGG